MTKEAYSLNCTASKIAPRNNGIAKRMIAQVLKYTKNAPLFIQNAIQLPKMALGIDKFFQAINCGENHINIAIGI